jgi:hypothetical protein
MDRFDATQVLREVEVSDWFDWMRREITQGGISLPNEETSVLLIARALHLESRIQHVYRHFPTGGRHTFIQSAIVYQCWQRQKEIQVHAKWPRTRSNGLLRGVEAIRYIRPIGYGRHHLVEASDGFQYLTTLSSGLYTDTLAATEMICNELARLMGLTVPGAAVVAISPELLRLADMARPDSQSDKHRRSTDLCCGFRYMDSGAPAPESGAEEPHVGRRILRQFFGALVFDLWTLQLSPRKWLLTADPATGRLEPVFVDHSRCLMGTNWSEFFSSTFQSVPSPQPVARKVTHWKQLEPWLKRIDNLDLNPVWDLVFQMPPRWYGDRRRHVTDVLGALQCRTFDLRRAVHYLAQIGYFANFKMPCKSVEATPRSEELPIPDARNRRRA